MLIRILLDIDRPSLCHRVERLISQPDVLVTAATGQGKLWESLSRDSWDLVLLARDLTPPAVSELLGNLRKLPDRPEVIVLQEHEDAQQRASLLAAGCLAVVSPHLPDSVLTETLHALVHRRRETLVSRLSADSLDGRRRLADFASASPAMLELLDLARRVARSDSSLLILGETGVGKEWLARAIHAEGARAASPFIAVNSAAMPESLLESELFGHERGAFTGAVRPRRGCFELAHRGTLFLDEVGDMPLHLQAKLLRVLQGREIQRVGGERPIVVDVRVMAATNHDLEEAMATKTFRRDLYYRLGVVTLMVPPLRQRREDIPSLVEAYVDHFRAQLGRPVTGIAPDALEALVTYSWPGNVRELINVMERAVLLCRTEEVTLADLPRSVSRWAGYPAGGGLGPQLLAPGWPDRPLRALRREVLANVERMYLEHKLAVTGGRVGETAKLAGMDPRSLYTKMRALGLRKEDFRRPEPDDGEPATSRRGARTL